MKTVASSLFTDTSYSLLQLPSTLLLFYHNHNVNRLCFLSYPIISICLIRFPQGMTTWTRRVIFWLTLSSVGRPACLSTQVMPTFKDLGLQAPLKGQNVVNIHVHGKR